MSGIRKNTETHTLTRGNLRSRILAFVCGLIIVSLAGSIISLYRITEVNRLLDAINRVSVPLGRLLTQMQADADLFTRELDRSLGSSHWKDPHWRARPVPRWIGDVLESEVGRVGDLLKTDIDWTLAGSPDTRAHWQEWAQNLGQGLANLKTDAAKLAQALDQNDQQTAAQLYPRWMSEMEDWRRQVQWGSVEYERSFRQTFSLAEGRVSELRTGLEMILGVVVALSLLLLWLGERALQPLAELTRLAREITRRGLRKEDKSLLPEISLGRSDEVGSLAREFHHMATALLEREKTVEAQKHRLIEQNRLLREMGELNENVLNSIESILIVTDLDGKIAHANPVAAKWLDRHAKDLVGTEISAWAKLREISIPEKAALSDSANRVEPHAIDGRVFGGQIFPLRDEGGEPRGAILVLDDLTDELDLEERLRRAENLAAIGRMSAQVAHEVRNPLHSIGLEAEVASELAGKIGQPALKQSLQSILSSVDRLEKITENYLRLSRLSAGEKSRVDLRQLLESVLATYAPVCEAQGVSVDWKHETTAPLVIFGDRDLLEQVFGNLFRNSLQALEGISSPCIRWSMGQAESGNAYVAISDNGPGVAPEIKAKLFTPFMTTRAQGTGLGLSFVKKVIEDHGGQIRLRERAEPGACFEMTLPLSATQFAAKNSTVESTAESNAEELHV